MKKILIVSSIVLLAIACEKEVDEIEKKVDEIEIVTASIKSSDDVVGVGQVIEITLDYSTSNPNILITWFENDEKLNSIPKSDLTYLWSPSKSGNYKLKAVITDRDNIVETVLGIDVMQCELANGIIGDSLEKILRTKGYKDNVKDVVTYNESGKISQYYFKDDKLVKIYYEHNINKKPSTAVDLTYPITMFKSMFQDYSARYGSPIDECYTDLGTSNEEVIRYGGYIYSGSMQVWAKYSNSDRNAEIYVEPTKYYNNGFRLTQQIELKK